MNFYFDVYKRKLFGLNNKLIKSYFGIWDGRKYNFPAIFETLRNFIMIKCGEDKSKNN